MAALAPLVFKLLAAACGRFLGTSGVFWDFLGLSGTFWDFLGLSGTFWDFLGATADAEDVADELLLWWCWLK
jgi:hypothetical protein